MLCSSSLPFLRSRSSRLLRLRPPRPHIFLASVGLPLNLPAPKDVAPRLPVRMISDNPVFCGTYVPHRETCLDQRIRLLEAIEPKNKCCWNFERGRYAK